MSSILKIISGQVRGPLVALVREPFQATYTELDTEAADPTFKDVQREDKCKYKKDWALGNNISQI